MPHLSYPRALADDTAYRAALDELVALDGSDPHDPRRREELTCLIEDYQARRAGYDLARMRTALAAWNKS